MYFPTSSFRKQWFLTRTDKVQLANAIWKCIKTCDITPPNYAHHALDAGWLLHKGIWKKGMIYKEIDYVKKHYGQNWSVVFDRYSSNESTKDITHLRCSKGKLGRPVLFNRKHSIYYEKGRISIKSQEINTAGMCATQSGGADSLIATVAFDISNSYWGGYIFAYFSYSFCR